MIKKVALVFPGLGYHPDKPLLYFGKKLAREAGYEVVEIRYGGFKYGVKDNPEMMREAFESALSQTEEILADREFGPEDDLLYVSKSIGTAVAAAWQKQHGLSGRHLYFTPVEETFQFVERESGIAFHGTADSWARTEAIRECCSKFAIPLFITEDANHSMETGDTDKDLEILRGIMLECKNYLL